MVFVLCCRFKAPLSTSAWKASWIPGEVVGREERLWLLLFLQQRVVLVVGVGAGAVQASMGACIDERGRCLRLPLSSGPSTSGSCHQSGFLKFPRWEGPAEPCKGPAGHGRALPSPASWAIQKPAPLPTLKNKKFR